LAFTFAAHILSTNATFLQVSAAHRQGSASSAANPINFIRFIVFFSFLSKDREPRDLDREPRDFVSLQEIVNKQTLRYNQTNVQRLPGFRLIML